jgi:hypothetical protein
MLLGRSLFLRDGESVGGEKLEGRGYDGRQPLRMMVISLLLQYDGLWPQTTRWPMLLRRLLSACGRATVDGRQLATTVSIYRPGDDG